MKGFFLCNLLILFFLGTTKHVEQADFYELIASDSELKIDQALVNFEIEETEDIIQKAYYYSLVVKKASYIKELKEKVRLCKEGIRGMEQLVEENPDNTEIRFIRLTLQENSPKILKYKENLDEDKLFILRNLKMQSAKLKQIIKKYALHSSILKSHELDAADM